LTANGTIVGNAPAILIILKKTKRQSFVRFAFLPIITSCKEKTF